MKYYGNNDWRIYLHRQNELSHFGIPRKSGRYPWGSGENPYHHGASAPKSKIRGADTYNFEKWGKDKDHNILYVTGYSGSGKSTLARQLADKDTDTIHLDIYFEGVGEDTKKSLQNQSFNEFLDKSGVDFRKINDGSLAGKEHQKERWKIIDELTEASEKFGAEQFKKGKKVIIEGVQLIDQTMYPIKDDLKGKPFAIMNTSMFVSNYRGDKRDGIAIYDLPTKISRLKAQDHWRKDLKNLRTSI